MTPGLNWPNIPQSIRGVTSDLVSTSYANTASSINRPYPNPYLPSELTHSLAYTSSSWESFEGLPEALLASSSSRWMAQSSICTHKRHSTGTAATDSTQEQNTLSTCVHTPNHSYVPHSLQYTHIHCIKLVNIPHVSGLFLVVTDFCTASLVVWLTTSTHYTIVTTLCHTLACHWETISWGVEDLAFFTY